MIYSQQQQRAYSPQYTACGPGGVAGAGGGYAAGGAGGFAVGGPGGAGVAGGYGYAGGRGGAVGGGPVYVGASGGGAAYGEADECGCMGGGVGPAAGAGCYAGGAMGCAEAGGCAEAAGPSEMAFVGWRRGNYITTTSYRYVGEGEGNLMMVTPKRLIMWRILCVILVPLLVLLAVYLATRPEPTSSSSLQNQIIQPPPTPEPTPPPATPEPRPEIGECSHFGDPHVLTFDKARANFYGDGEFWIVKSSKVFIQGRYKGTIYTKGLAATNKIVVGGPFLKGHKITIGTLEDGDIEVDGVPVMTTFPSSYSLEGLASLTYNSDGHLVDQATGVWAKRAVTLRLPEQVEMTIFRWKNYLDFRIRMAAQPDQDGTCGNFNGDPSDDDTADIMSRIGARVEKGSNMFNSRTIAKVTETEEKLLKACPANEYAQAKAACHAAAPADSPLWKLCVLDECYGGNAHTLRLAKDLGI